MSHETLIKRLRWTAENDEQVFDAETAVLAADALANADILAQSDAKIIKALNSKLNAAWKENEELRRELKKVKPELEGYA